MNTMSAVVKAEADESRLKSLHSPALFSVEAQPRTSLCCYLEKENVNCSVTPRQHGRRANIGVLLCKVAKSPPATPINMKISKAKKKPTKGGKFSIFSVFSPSMIDKIAQPLFCLLCSLSHLLKFQHFHSMEALKETWRGQRGRVKNEGNNFPKRNGERN